MTPIALSPLSPATTQPTQSPGKTEKPSRSFAQVMQATPPPPPEATAPNVVRSVIHNVAAGHREMDRIIKLAQSGRTFSSAQLIGLQARVFRLSTEIDLASKLLEKVTSGVKQAMSTQV